ncbi:MAG: hypothetical protein M3457_13620, partial [Chloroflexota bacterium]|nr:hypothetical protein [Chloroflexota bacterium]
TAAEINVTWREFIACINTNDFSRIFALISDDKLRRDFVLDFAAGGTEETMIAFFTATPVALEPAMRAPFIPLADIQLLADGRVSAIGPGTTGEGEMLIFVEEGDRWLIDDQFDLQPGGTTEAATPAA